MKDTNKSRWAARRAARMAYRMRRVRSALKFKERWAANPEGMERRRKAGSKANGAAWAETREKWREWWGSKADRLTPEQARLLAQSFLKQMRGKWRTKVHPRCARSVLKRVAKLGVWRFDDRLGLYINPAMEQARRMEQARMREAEARAAEKERLAAERAEAAEAARREKEAAEAAAKAEREKPAPPGWHLCIPEGEREAVLGWMHWRRHLAPGMALGDATARAADLVLSWKASPETWAGLLDAGGKHIGRRAAELSAVAEAVLCAD